VQFETSCVVTERNLCGLLHYYPSNSSRAAAIFVRLKPAVLFKVARSVAAQLRGWFAFRILRVSAAQLVFSVFSQWLRTTRCFEIVFFLANFFMPHPILNHP
jgi:hypothetical protein